jgi:hypothetical protein
MDEFESKLVMFLEKKYDGITEPWSLANTATEVALRDLVN